MIITQDTVLDYREEVIPNLVSELSQLSHKEKRDAVVTYLSQRIGGGVDKLKAIGLRRGQTEANRIDFTVMLLEALERDFINDEDADNLFSLKDAMRTGNVITNKFGKPCYISNKIEFKHDTELAELFGGMGKGELLETHAYIFEHERKTLRARSQDSFIRIIDSSTTGARLEFCELNPDTYRVFYSVQDSQGTPQFVYDKNERRFVNYWWGQPNAYLRPLHETTRGVDMTKHLLTRNSDNDNTLEVCVEFGCPKTKENDYKNKKREWRPFSEYWYNSIAVVKETDRIQGVVSVAIRGMKRMTIPEIDSSLITSDPNAMTLDDEKGYDDIAYNMMVNFNPQKVLVQIATNDKKGLGLRDSEDVTVNQRLKAAEILYNKMTRTKPVQKTQRSDDNEDKAHVVVTFPEKEGYADEGKQRLKVGTDEAQAVLDFVTNSYSRDEEAEYVEV